ncbi:unnamed protein product [Caenorhabditis angaria]|uniref:Uncharacterized protein n=1 Tax=Caenorhabditis angaria TaxID=860376 RepID=A0A9P1IQK6_9PELO|nr:unnamed protein product [Caenorhabditis angaria]
MEIPSQIEKLKRKILIQNARKKLKIISSSNLLQLSLQKIYSSNLLYLHYSTHFLTIFSEIIKLNSRKTPNALHILTTI